MKKSVFMAIALFVMAATAWGTGYRSITSREARDMLLKRKDVFLLDVRTPEEYRQARLQGGKLIPVDSIAKRLAEIPKKNAVIVYCAVGSRSVPVANFLAGNGYRNVYNMSDGIVGWYRNGYPLER